MIELPDEKPSLEEAYQNTLNQFSFVLNTIDELIERLKILQNKKMKRGKDKEIGVMLEGILLIVKTMSDSLGRNWRMTFLLRDLVFDYDKSIKQLTESVESLAKESTNKQLTTRILKETVEIKDKMKKIEQKADDVRLDIEDFDKWRDDIARKFSKGDKKDG